jgi:hypothetical protein
MENPLELFDYWETCGICLDEHIDVTPCKFCLHFNICGGCLSKYIENDSRCPQCRVDLAFGNQSIVYEHVEDYEIHNGFVIAMDELEEIFSPLVYRPNLEELVVRTNYFDQILMDIMAISTSRFLQNAGFNTIIISNGNKFGLYLNHHWMSSVLKTKGYILIPEMVNHI